MGFQEHFEHEALETDRDRGILTTTDRERILNGVDIGDGEDQLSRNAMYNWRHKVQQRIRNALLDMWYVARLPNDLLLPIFEEIDSELEDEKFDHSLYHALVETAAVAARGGGEYAAPVIETGVVQAKLREHVRYGELYEGQVELTMSEQAVPFADADEEHLEQLDPLLSGEQWAGYHLKHELSE